jgi:hypothetical protein
VAVTVAGLAISVSVFGGVLDSMHGAWETPTQNYAAFTDILAERSGDSGRVLWIGDASVLPIDVVTSNSGIQYAMTDGGVPEVWGRWSSGPVGATGGVGYHLDLARAGETVRLGRLLAPYGIDLVVVVNQLAPAPYEGPTVDPGRGIVGSLAQQLDLERVPGVPNLIVFRNAASAGTAVQLPSAEAAEAVEPADQLDVDLSTGPPLDVEILGLGRWLLDVPKTDSVLLAVPSQGIELRGVDLEDQAVVAGFDGLTIIPSAVTGEVEVRYPTPLGRRLGQLGQLVVVGVGAILAQTRREVQT